MVNEKMTLLVATCDNYSDVWEDFFACKKINWPDCPFETVLVTEEKEAKGFDARTFKGGKENNWSTRMRLALESIDTKYICFLMEDFLLADPIETEEIHRLINLMERDKLRYCKLCEVGVIKTAHYQHYNYLRVIPENLRYGISLMAAIWDREFFLEKLGTGDYDPWQFEADRNREAQQASNQIIGLFDERDILHICQLVVQGKILPDAIRMMKKRGYIIQDKERVILSFQEDLMYKTKVRVARVAQKLPFLKTIAIKMGYQVRGDK